MEKIIKGIKLHDIGHKLVIEGLVLNGRERTSTKVLMFPGKILKFTDADTNQIHEDLDMHDWELILLQMDTMELEVTAGEKLPKIILRKSQRNIEQKVSWAVYRRDNFTCRYCGDDTSPMTVDHLRTWESGGPSIPVNLLTSCKKCNRNRGNTPYEEWINSKYYLNVSKKLPLIIKSANIALVSVIKEIPLNKHKRRR